MPKYCPQLEDPNDCWWEITPPSGKDVFTVIFSRDKITDLTDKLSSNKSTDDPDAVDMNIISKIKSTSNTKDIARVKEIKVNSTRETKATALTFKTRTRTITKRYLKLLNSGINRKQATLP